MVGAGQSRTLAEPSKKKKKKQNKTFFSDLKSGRDTFAMYFLKMTTIAA